MVKSVLYRIKATAVVCICLCLLLTLNSHLSSPKSVPLVYLLTYFSCLCLLITSLFHLFFWFPQLPEPLILFRYYNDFIGLAKESQRIIVEELEALRLSPTPVAPAPAQVSVELNRVLFKIKDLLRQLPPAHYKTLQFLIEHLHRYGRLRQITHKPHFC